MKPRISNIARKIGLLTIITSILQLRCYNDLNTSNSDVPHQYNEVDSLALNSMKAQTEKSSSIIKERIEKRLMKASKA
jgi:hypothetical protein